MTKRFVLGDVGGISVDYMLQVVLDREGNDHYSRFQHASPTIKWR